MNFMNWAIDPRNQKKSLSSLIFTLIVVTVNPKILEIDKNIEQHKECIEHLRENSAKFRKTTGEAREVLKKKGLSLDEYAQNVRRMQDLAELLCDPMFKKDLQEKKNFKREDPDDR